PTGLSIQLCNLSISTITQSHAVYLRNSSHHDAPTQPTDDFYRYKMPRLIAKVEGKGNGIKTVIVNMHEVGKALCRPPIYPTKYFGAELGAQTQFDQKNDRYIVNGAHDAEKLQTILDGFIKRYVLCSECENPETDLIVKSRGKQGELYAKCKACGSTGTVVDNSRTTQFIIKNPPDETGLALASSTKSGAGGGKKQRRGGAGADKQADRSPEAGNSDENDEQQQKLMDEEDGNEIGGDGFDSDNGEWEDGPVGVEERVEELPESIRRLIVTEDLLQLTPQDRADRFHKMLSDKLASGFTKDTPQELLQEADRLDIRDKAVVVVAEVLLNNPGTLAADITKKYRSVFLAFTNGNPRSQKYLIGAVESLVQRYKDALLDAKRIPNLLNAFYNADLLSEETLIEWADKGPTKRHTGDRKLSKQIHELAKPFITWLKTADVESSDEDEEEEEEQQKPEQKPKANGAAAGKPAEKPQQQQAKQAAVEEDNESDVDIDNI
uniref:Eukaryotic translation initiation factor 5 n=1 Tax=Macrostomum lignano TaxID=282301 RepID=A0A1I8G3F3_9PLAT